MAKDIDFTVDLFAGSGAPAEAEFFIAKYDPAQAIAQFEKHKAKIELLHKEALAFEIKDDDSREVATKRAANAQKAVKELKALKDRFIRPHKDFTSAVEGAFKRYSQMIKDDVIEVYRQKDQVYAAQKKLREQKEAEDKRKEAEEIQKKLAAEAKNLGMPAPRFDMPQIKTKKMATVQTSKGSSYQKKVPNLEIVDLDLVPREYMVPNLSLITTDCKAGKKIPGVKFEWVDKTIYLTK